MSSLTKAIRIGVIGAGGNTKKLHIPLLQAIPSVSIVAVCNRSIQSGSEVAKQFGIPKVCTDWREIIEDPNIDAVVIGTWPYLHKTLTVQSLLANKHVLTEARMAMNSAEAREMLQVSLNKPHLVAQIVPSPFTLKYDKTIQQLVKDRYLGDILYVEVKSVGNDFPNSSTPLTWRQDTHKSGLNVMDMGIWVEALHRWIGPAKSLVASATTVTKTRIDSDSNAPVGVQVPEHLDILADMACGAKAHFLFSSVLGFAGGEKTITLYGSEGTVKLDYKNDQLLAGKKGSASLDVVQVKPEDEGKWNVEQDFIDSIRHGASVRLTNFRDGVRYMDFTQAVFESCSSGSRINLPISV
eukprot:TRINITY_DN1594_c0_g1_i1.p1 TRINITY_DN1594_c0_g1~~TRINITY_DN1594_c0_g1_i1.p1  ORF type:complete len:353 (+),score=62.49 TRINITY_DN1594_c0_g1_i1:127-1185(+)